MHGNYYNHDNMINNQSYASLQYTGEVFKAFVDAIIPRTPELAEEFGKIQYFGALDFYTDEYIILSLDNYYFPIAVPVAEMLEKAAEQLIFTEGSRSLELSISVEESPFGALAPIDQLRVLAQIDQITGNKVDLPLPFQNDPGYILYITSALNRFVMMGYYSEWFGYGSTRLESPNQRKLEYFPLSWNQVGYPGPSLGYRALRVNSSH